MDPNNAIRRRGGGDCVGNGFIKNLFVGDVWMRWGEFIIAGLIFVEGCFQNAANEGSGAGMRLGDLDGVSRAEASSDL